MALTVVTPNKAIPNKPAPNKATPSKAIGNLQIRQRVATP